MGTAKNSHTIITFGQIRREVLCDDAIVDLQARAEQLELAPDLLGEMEAAASTTMQNLLRKSPAYALKHSLPDMVSKALMYLDMVDNFSDVRAVSTLARMAASIEVNSASYRAIFNISGSQLSARNDFALAAALETVPQDLPQLIDYLEGPFSSLFVEAIRRRNSDASQLIEAQKQQLEQTGGAGLEIFCRVPNIPALG